MCANAGHSGEEPVTCLFEALVQDRWSGCTCADCGEYAPVDQEHVCVILLAGLLLGTGATDLRGDHEFSLRRGKVVKGMSAALKSMKPERISAILDKFEQQFEDLDVRNQPASVDSTAVVRVVKLHICWSVGHKRIHGRVHGQLTSTNHTRGGGRRFDEGSG